MRKFFRLLCAFFLTFLFCFNSSVSFAQTSPSDNYGSLIGDEQIEEWLGREARLDHPVVSDLAREDASGLHFFFERGYARRAESVIRTAQDARQKTLRFLPPETAENVVIYLLGDINRYFREQNSPGRAPDWAAGLTILRDGVILIRLSPRGASRIEPEMTLAHELNHVALRRIARDADFPHWFYEGLAMTSTDDWNLTRAETLARASMSGNLLDLDGIDASFGLTAPPSIWPMRRAPISCRGWQKNTATKTSENSSPKRPKRTISTDHFRRCSGDLRARRLRCGATECLAIAAFWRRFFRPTACFS